MKARSYTKPSRPSVIEKRLRQIALMASQAADALRGQKLPPELQRATAPTLTLNLEAFRIMRDSFFKAFR